MQKSPTTQFLTRQGGFTLAEVVLAMLIMAGSALGVAAMQMMSLQANRGAFYRSQALQIGAEILDSIRANSAQAASYAGVSYSATSNNTGDVPVDPGCAAEPLGCSEEDMASLDLRHWSTHFVNLFSSPDFRPTLPGGVGEIEVDGDVYTVTVTWDQQLFVDDGSGKAERKASTDSVTLSSAITP